MYQLRSLLMNVFCYPEASSEMNVGSILCDARSTPDLGCRARVPLAKGKFARTKLRYVLAPAERGETDRE